MGGTCSNMSTELKFNYLKGSLLLIGVVSVILQKSGLSMRQHGPRSACSMWDPVVSVIKKTTKLDL
jgi:hypothetical protein